MKTNATGKRFRKILAWVVFGLCVIWLILMVAISIVRGAEPTTKCASIESALGAIMVEQALKTSEQNNLALRQMGMSEDLRLRVYVVGLQPEIIRRIRDHHNAKLQARAKTILMLAGCP